MILPQIGDGLLALDLCNDARGTSGLAHQRARLLDIGGIARERHRDVVNSLPRAKADIVLVLLGQRRRRDTPALAIESLAIRELAAQAHATFDARAGNRGHVEHDLAVGEQQRIAGADVARQILIGDAHFARRALFGVERGIERKARALFQPHGPIAKALDADLRAAQVHEHSHRTVGTPRGRAHLLHAARMVLLGAVRGVDARNVDAPS